MGAYFLLYEKQNNQISDNSFLPLIDTMNSFPFDDTYSFNEKNIAIGESTRVSSDRVENRKKYRFEINKKVYYLIGRYRLDNYEALCELLNQENKSLSAEELLIMLYLEYAKGFADKLLGDFSFCIVDVAKEEIICIRDHMGIEPLYYHNGDKFIVVSDSIEVILAHPEIPAEFNESVVAEWLSVQRVYNQDETFFKRLHKCPRATEVYIGQDTIQKYNYWDITKIKPLEYKSEQEYIEQLEKLLLAVIQDRTKTVYPFAAHLSGGLDSTPLAVISGRELKKKNIPFYTFNWCKPRAEDENLENHEWDDARNIAKEEEFSHFEIGLSTGSLKTNILEHDIALDGTTMYEYESVLLPQAKELGVRTILSGFGGDEILTSKRRETYFDAIRKGDFKRVYKNFRDEMEPSKKGKLRILYKLLKQTVKAFLSTHFLYRKRIQRDKKRFMFSLSMMNKSMAQKFSHKNYDIDYYMQETIRDTQLININCGYHQERLESWAALGRRVGVKYVYPLLDKRIVEFALALPAEMYFKAGKDRYLYRKVIRNYVPDYIHTKLKPPETYRVGHLVQEKKALLKSLKLESFSFSFIDNDNLIKEYNLLDKDQEEFHNVVMRTKVLNVIAFLTQLEKKYKQF